LIATGRAYARAALAGNPSDGYGGAVIGTRPTGDAWPALRAALEAEACSVIEPTLG
jgi:hypothetical protein